jgi:hypothetical protein
VAFFAFALVTVVLLKNMWVIQHLGILASGTLFTGTLLSITIGQPFTEDYAREHVPPELWDSPGFIRSSYTVTRAWGFIFLLNTLVNVAKPHSADLGEWFFRGLELSILVSGVVFTNLYSQAARKKRQSIASNSDDLEKKVASD